MPPQRRIEPSNEDARRQRGRFGSAQHERHEPPHDDKPHVDDYA